LTRRSVPSSARAGSQELSPASSRSERDWCKRRLLKQRVCALTRPERVARIVLGAAVAAALGLASGALAHSDFPPPAIASVGPLRVTYPSNLRSDGVLFDLYRSPRQQPVATRTVPPPLSLADFHAVVRGMHPTGEQREVFFQAKGANYWAVAWIGQQATKSERNDLTGVTGSIQLVK